MDQIIEILAGLIAVIFIFAPHEFAHAFAAYKSGDATAKMYGRLTLNPVKHLDPVGFVLCAVTGFGWAKPVPINPYNFRNYRKGMFFTAIAGVVTNYIIAFFAYPMYLVIFKYLYMQNFTFFYNNPFLSGVVEVLYLSFFFIYAYGMSVFVFNLLPLFPLDGFRIVEAFTREVNPVRRFLETYGRYILLILVLESFLCNMLVRNAGLDVMQYFNILGWVGWFAQNIIGFPITAFWGLIFGV